MKMIVCIVAALYLCIVASAAEATTIDFVRTGNTLNFTVINEVEHPFTSSELTPASYSSFTESTSILEGTSVYAVSFILAEPLTTETLRFTTYDSAGNLIGFNFSLPQLSDLAPAPDAIISAGPITDGANPGGPGEISSGLEEDATAPAISGPGSETTPVPEPATVALLGAGLGCLALYRRRN